MEQLHVTANGHYLETDLHKPFFYLADTAWELFHRLHREEARMYLKNRARKGFTVIQAVVLAEVDGLHSPNAYGECPLIDDDPTRPNPEYFSHIDAIVQMATELGLHIAMLPTWGDKVGPGGWGTGPAVFTPDNAHVYGEFLGRRYRNAPIIWVLGGDRPIDNAQQRLSWRALAEGVAAGDGGVHLRTFHPPGVHSSSEFVHEEAWLDFHMIQSGHNHRNEPNYELVSRDYQLTPTRPVLDGELRYEDHPVSWKPDDYGWMEADDVRRGTYWALLAGGCGVTYGCHDIWQFWQRSREPISFARTPWQMAIDLPGSTHVGYARALYEARPFPLLHPAQEMIVDGQGEGAHHVQVARASDDSFAFVYIPTGRRVRLDLSGMPATLTMAFYDPRTGAWHHMGGVTPGIVDFTPPTSGFGADWVLVLDDVTRNFPAPVCPWAI